MRVKLLAPHVIRDVMRLPKEELELPPDVAVTVLMEPLDREAEEAIAREKLRIHPDGVERGLTNQVEPPFPQGGPGR